MLFRRRQPPKANSTARSGDILPSAQAFRRVIDRERERAGRNRHSVSLVLIQIEKTSGKSNQIPDIINTIQTRIRQVDEMGWYDAARLGIILPYTSREGACRLTHDLITRLAPAPDELNVEVFTFPGNIHHEESAANLDAPGGST